MAKILQIPTGKGGKGIGIYKKGGNSIIATKLTGKSKK
jgi:hypothetical protein